MSKRTTTSLILFGTLLLAACGQPPVQDSTSVTDSLNALATSKLKFDRTTAWYQGLAQIADVYPAFAGYDIDAQQGVVTLLVAKFRQGRSINPEERGNKLGLIRQAFINLAANSQDVPAPTDEQGQAISLTRLKYRFKDVKYSLADLNSVQGQVERSQTSWGAVGIDIPGNRIRIRVDNNIDASILMQLSASAGIAKDGVELSYGEVITNKAVNVDRYEPASGGVQVFWAATSTSTTGKGCTLGLPVTVNGVTGYLTAAHCSTFIGRDDDNALFQTNQRIIGIEQNDGANIPTPTGQEREAEVVFYKTTVPYTQGRIARSDRVANSYNTLIDAAGKDLYLDVTNTVVRPPAPGSTTTVLESIGATSGYRTATVTNENTSVNLSKATPPLIIRGTVEVTN